MKFQTHRENRIKTPTESNNSGKITNTLGYVPLNIKVQQLLNAGKRLQEYQDGYDFTNDEIDENYYPKTRMQNYDIADAFNDNISLQNKMQEAKREAAVKASIKAQEAKLSEGQTSGEEDSNKPV